VAGDVISGCRDNETRTYRLFVNKGWRDVQSCGSMGHQIDACKSCDLSIEDLRQLASTLAKAVAAHEPWPEEEPRDTLS
jgi:hypothetical protein